MRSDEWAQYHEVQAIKGQSGKFGKRAEKVMVLIWGDLFAGRANRQGSLRNESERTGVSRGHSTGSVVSSHREGLNSKLAWSEKFAERAWKAVFPG